MKTLATLITIILAITTSVLQAQQLTAKSYLEQTYVGPKLGTAIGLMFPCNIEVGGFYQESTTAFGEAETLPWLKERQFAGAFMNYPIMQKEFLGLSFNIRTGVSNGENFLITPTVLGYIMPLPRVKVSGGLGVRAFSPTLQGGITLVLSK
ncbi:MAG: hypothetical protein JXR10_16925 [Cyclobacteriaceae bacterium]